MSYPSFRKCKIAAGVFWLFAVLKDTTRMAGTEGREDLSLVFRVLVCGGRRGYRAWWHELVGLLRFRGLLVGLWARGRGCQ